VNDGWPHGTLGERALGAFELEFEPQWVEGFDWRASWRVALCDKQPLAGERAPPLNRHTGLRSTFRAKTATC
jgi:hypothetical protein